VEKGQARKTSRNVIIISPNYLKVDKAIILLKSNLEFAPRPAINTVNPETNNKTTFNQ